MASTPSNPVPPNDPKSGQKGKPIPPAGGTDPKARPASTPDIDWLSEIEAMATPGPRKFEADPDDAELDLRALFEDAEDSGPLSFSRLTNGGKDRPSLPGEPDDGVDVQLGQGQPITPASGWLDVPPTNVMPIFPVTPTTHDSISNENDADIFTMKSGPASSSTTGGSDVLRVSHRPTPSSSNIFDAPAAGSR